MKFFKLFARASSELNTHDETHLLRHESSYADLHADDISEEINENDIDKIQKEAGSCKRCGTTEANFLERNDVAGGCDAYLRAESYDVTICGGQESESLMEVTEVIMEEEGDNKKTRKKKFRKRVRKRVWRVVRSSWKYLRRGMVAYSPGFAAIFTWGINMNQGMGTQRPSASKYL